MKSYNISILIVICISLALSSCSKEPLTAYEGDWKLVDTIGGLHGGGVEVSWNKMKIEDTQFEVFQDGVLILRADLIFDGIVEGDSETVMFDFTFDPESSDLKYINEFDTKYFRFTDTDQLIIDDGCCDLYGYVFEKE